MVWPRMSSALRQRVEDSLGWARGEQKPGRALVQAIED